LGWGGIENVIARISTEKRLDSASKPLKTAGNCISANPKFNFYGEGRALDSPPAKHARTALVKGLQ